MDHHMKTMRRPTWGIMPPKGVVLVRVDKPVNLETEAPLLLASVNNALVIKAVAPDAVTIENNHNRPVFYTLVIVPRVLLEAVKTPWKQIWEESPLRKLWESLRAGGEEP